MHGQQHGNSRIERQIPRHLIRRVPERIPTWSQEERRQRTDEAVDGLASPPRCGHLRKGPTWKVPVPAAVQKECRTEAAVVTFKQRTPKVQAEPSEATVDVPQLLQVDGDIWQRLGHSCGTGGLAARRSARHPEAAIIGPHDGNQA